MSGTPKETKKNGRPDRYIDVWQPLTENEENQICNNINGLISFILIRSLHVSVIWIIIRWFAKVKGKVGNK